MQEPPFQQLPASEIPIPVALHPNRNLSQEQLLFLFLSDISLLSLTRVLLLAGIPRCPLRVLTAGSTLAVSRKCL